MYRRIKDRIKTPFFLIATTILLTSIWFAQRSPIIIPSRTLKSFEYATYHHPPSTPSSPHFTPTRIFHIAKEFGPATMGGLGVMLTALAIAQSQTDLDISIILPHYAFLSTEYQEEIVYHSTVGVPIHDAKGAKKVVDCRISSLEWRYNDAGDFLSPHIDSPILPTIKSITVYLVGPGNISPFQAAFQVPTPEAIYSSPHPLPQEWKDLWFAKSAALFVLSMQKKVEVVHLHGATNALVAYFLRESGEWTPAIVYTLHDSLDEVEYTNLVGNVVRFLDPPNSAPFAPYHPRQLLYSPTEFTDLSPSSLFSLTPWIHHERYQNLLPSLYKTDNRQLFTSALGIDLADQVTFVSRSIAQDLVEGRFRFPGEELVMSSILHRARMGDFVGVSNGLDFTVEGRNPFISERLLREGLAFPRVGNDLMNEETFSESFVEQKRRAKEYLIGRLPHYFSSADLDRPLLLFIGRFQYNKGVEFFSPLLHHLSLNSTARLIALGTQNNYPISTLRSLAVRYPHQFTFIEDPAVQKEFGSIIRLASDFAFVPSFSEAFGLVAVEGMLFGMSVISSGVGGLKEFLRPGPEGNAHLFEIFPGGRGLDEGTVESLARKARPGEIDLRDGLRDCLRVVEEAIEAWRARRGEKERERFVRRMVSTALALRWDRLDGPVAEYTRIYSRAQSLHKHNTAE